MSIIYGLNTSKPFKPQDVRDAIIECFYDAHKEDLMEMDMELALSKEDKEEMHKSDVIDIVRRAFDLAHADWDNPTKEGIVNAIDKLTKYAKNFRNQEIIKKHYDQIMTLVNLL